MNNNNDTITKLNSNEISTHTGVGKLVRVQYPTGIKLVPMNRKQRRQRKITKEMCVNE